jgi:cardiolipin synthase
MICGGKRKNVKKLLRYSYKVEDENINFIYDEAHFNGSSARKKYIEALKKAKEKVIFFSPYYFPDKYFLKALWVARKKGIKIDLLFPFRSDVRIATYVAYAWFNLMTKMGINVYITKDMMHGKGVIVDDKWAMVGSSNLDHLSFHRNYEANIQLKEKKIVKKIKNIIYRWKKDSIKINDKNWKSRSRLKKWREKIWNRIYVFWFNIKNDHDIK